MSDDGDLYRVLYTDVNGHEQLTEAMPYDAARSRAQDLEKQGHVLGSVMGDVAARGYMHAKYGPTYRGVKVPLDLRADGAPRRVFEEWKRGVDAELDGDKPKPASTDPFAPDLTMSREVADFVLRAVTGLMWEGYWPKAYETTSRHAGTDDQEYDDLLLLKAASIVGRDKIKNQELLDRLADLDADDGGAS